MQAADVPETELKFIIAAQDLPKIKASPLLKVREGKQKRVALTQPVPVEWTYLDAWASADGTVHYRPDVYDLDGAGDQHWTPTLSQTRPTNLSCSYRSDQGQSDGCKPRRD